MNRSFQQTTAPAPAMTPTIPNNIPQPASVSSNNSESQRNNDPQPAPTPQAQEQPQPPARRREVYRYNTNVPLYASSWSHKVYQEKKFRIAAGTCMDLENLSGNKLSVIELDENVGELVEKCHIDHGYPSSGIQFIPSNDLTLPELIASATEHLRLYRYNLENPALSLECELVSNKPSQYMAPLTSLDWNEVDPAFIGTSSIDTTCTIWNIEIGKAAASTKVEGKVKTQLIAHEKPVHDLAFSKFENGRDTFATASADGSVRLFDLRSLEHSTILYEDPEKRMLNRVAWNKQESTQLATIAHDSAEVLILDIRVPCQPIAKFNHHRGAINGIAWAPFTAVHICTAGADKQALIWQVESHLRRDEPILAYTAEGEINTIKWDPTSNEWICITFDNSLEILRV